MLNCILHCDTKADSTARQKALRLRNALAEQQEAVPILSGNES